VRIKLVKRVNPVYPEEAKKQGITGTVICGIKIAETGKVESVEVKESPDELLSGSAVEAVRQWEYEPPTKDGTRSRRSPTSLVDSNSSSGPRNRSVHGRRSSPVRRLLHDQKYRQDAEEHDPQDQKGVHERDECRLLLNESEQDPVGLLGGRERVRSL